MVDSVCHIWMSCILPQMAVTRFPCAIKPLGNLFTVKKAKLVFLNTHMAKPFDLHEEEPKIKDTIWLHRMEVFWDLTDQPSIPGTGYNFHTCLWWTFDSVSWTVCKLTLAVATAIQTRQWDRVFPKLESVSVARREKRKGSQWGTLCQWPPQRFKMPTAHKLWAYRHATAQCQCYHSTLFSPAFELFLAAVLIACMIPQAWKCCVCISMLKSKLRGVSEFLWRSLAYRW